MATLTNVTPGAVAAVLQDLIKEAETHTTLSLDSKEYIRSVLTRALGEDRAGNVDTETLIIALKFGPHELRQKFMAICRNVRRNCFPTIWRQAARCVSRKSKHSSAKFCRSRAILPEGAR